MVGVDRQAGPCMGLVYVVGAWCVHWCMVVVMWCGGGIIAGQL